MRADTQRKHAGAIFRHAVLTEDYNKLLEARRAARAKANEASCWQAAAGSNNVVVAQLVDTLKESFKFSEEQLEQLQTKAFPNPTDANGVATSNRYACLEEGWRFHPLFKPTAADDPIVATTNPTPAAAFPGWWDRPAETIQEAGKFVEASNKISEKRKELWESKDKNPEKIHEAAADLANSGIPTVKGGRPPLATSAHCRLAL